MNEGRVLLDTGPLIALHRMDDPARAPCEQVVSRLTRPLLSCWPVLTEAAYLLRHSMPSIQAMFGLVEQGIIEIDHLDGDDLPGIHRIWTQYSDQGFQLADVCLMYLAEREEIETVFTLDRRDFTVFRNAAKKPLVIVPG